MLETFTIDMFEPLVGTSFWVEFPNDAKVELRLVRVGKVMESELARLDRQPFSLFFLGPKSFLLKQNTYRLTHQSLEPMEIFVVPVADQGSAYEYEAVFT